MVKLKSKLYAELLERRGFDTNLRIQAIQKENFQLCPGPISPLVG